MNDITLFGVFVGMAVVAYILYTHKLDMKDFEARYAVQQPAPMTDAQPPISKRRKIREDSDHPLPGHEGLFGPLKKVEGGPIRVIRETPTLSLLMKDQAISTDNTEIREGAATNKRLREREEDKPNTDLKRKQAISSTISNVKVRYIQRQAMFYNIDAFKNRREKFYEALSKLQASPGKPKTISSFVGSLNTTTQSPAKTITTQSNLYVSPSEQTSVVANAAPTIKKSLFPTNESKKEPHATMTPIFSKSEEIKDQPTPTISQFKPQETKPTLIFGATAAKPETTQPASSTPASSLFSGQPQSLFNPGKAETSVAEKQQFGKPEGGHILSFGSSTASTPSLGSSNIGSGLFGGKTDTSTTATPAVSSALFGGSTTSPSTGGLFGQSGGSSTGTGSLFGSSTQGTGLFGNTASNTPKETPAPSGLLGAQTGATTATTTGGSLFGSRTASSSAGGLFGSTSAPSTSGGLFGASSTSTTPSLGTQPTTSLFGAQSATPANTTFGAQPASTTSASPFGAQPASTTSASPFGAQPASTTSTSLFGGQPVSTTSASLFGGQPVSTTGFGTQPPTSSTGGFGAQTSTNGFGASTTPTSPFGTQPQASTGGFGAQPSSTGLFGSSSNTGFGTNPAPSFGQPTTPNSSLFGATNPSSPAPGSLFGSTATSTQPGSLFGAQSSQPASLFGGQIPAQGAQFGSTPQSSNLFGNNPTPSGGLFGGKQPGTSFGTGFGAQGNTIPSQSLFGSTPGQGGTVTNPLFASKS